MDEKALLAKIEALEKEVARLSKHTDAVEVQNLMSRYIFYMENGKIAEVWDDLWSHTNPDVRVEIMDSGAYLGQEHVKRVWYTMGRRMDKHGNMIDTTPKVQYQYRPGLPVADADHLQPHDRDQRGWQPRLGPVAHLRASHQPGL